MNFCHINFSLWNKLIHYNDKNAFQSKAYLPLADRKSNT